MTALPAAASRAVRRADAARRGHLEAVLHMVALADLENTVDVARARDLACTQALGEAGAAALSDPQVSCLAAEQALLVAMTVLPACTGRHAEPTDTVAAIHSVCGLRAFLHLHESAAAVVATVLVDARALVAMQS